MMIRGMVPRANDVPARHLFAAYCYCCCTYSYSLFMPFGGILTLFLVHKIVQLALSSSTASSKVCEQGSAAPLPPLGRHSRTACPIAVPALQDELDGGWRRRTVGMASAFTGWVPGCLPIVLQSVRSHLLLPSEFIISGTTPHT
jgi:hypothetical protein